MSDFVKDGGSRLLIAHALSSIYFPLGKVIGAQNNSEVIARLDRLESHLQQKGVLDADIKREIAELRTELRQ